jgi:PPP family 3-phenylpropionic acid transporter
MSSAWRLGLFYALMFLVSGASLPYMPVWLRAQGLDGATIGAIIAAPYLARVVTGQIAAHWADGFRQRRTSLLLLSLIATASFASLLVIDSAWGHAAAWFVGSTASMAILPLTDVLTLRLSRREGFAYGRARAAGSAAFIVANLAVGFLLAGGAADQVVVWMSLATLALAIGVRLLLPAEPIHDPADAPPDRRAGLGDLLRNRLFMLAIVSAGLIQAAHAFQYAFSRSPGNSRG